MIDRQYIFNKVNFFLKKENKFFSSSDVNMIIGVDSFRRIATEINYPKSNYEATLTSGSWVVSAPIDFIRVDRNSDVTYYNGTTVNKLTPKQLFDIGRENVLDAVPSTPENYFMESEAKIGIYPPCTSGMVVIPYVKEPVVLSSDGDTNELTERCYMASVYWTVSECMIADSDERVIGYKQMYDTEIKRLKDEYRRIYEIPQDLKPHRDYRK